MIINSGYANSITGDVDVRHVRLPELDESSLSSLYTGFYQEHPFVQVYSSKTSPSTR